MNIDKIIDKRLDFLLPFKDLIQSKEFASLEKTWKSIEEDYTKIVIPSDQEKMYEYHDGKHITRSTLGKILKKHYKVNQPDHLIAEFVNRLNVLIWKQPPDVAVFSGSEIIDMYVYFQSTRYLSSCMTGQETSRCVTFFAMNPDKVKLHCLEEGGEIKARCLVWEPKPNVYVVDRIYPNTGEWFHKMKEMYRDRKYIMRKGHQATSGTNLIGGHTFTMEMKRLPNQLFPYMDTFRYGYESGDNMVVTNTKSSLCTHKFNKDTGGFTFI